MVGVWIIDGLIILQIILVPSVMIAIAVMDWRANRRKAEKERIEGEKERREAESPFGRILLVSHGRQLE